ncbi:asparagine synthase-related protein [Amycolatopsis sp. CA-128772]|uniref:asparagine synthase-related protein n=1 Tax=Amycolatopsis sp. CA-128772 TaxID=2073159 RepID=UPI0013049EAE|nr:asparagine synthase-related protein [Amycolatopsis sp. CA-128772]
MDRSWFVVLPDAGGSRAIADALRRTDRGIEVHDHPSGHPWLAGRFRPGHLVVGRQPGLVTALVGEHAATEHTLRALPADLPRAVAALAELPGSSHVIAADHRRLRVQGTASGLRRVHRCRIGGVEVLGDSAAVLAKLAGTGFRPGAIASRLVFPGAPWPLSWEPVWAGVRAVGPGEYAEVTAAGCVEGRWWTPPEPDRPLEAVAEELRAELDRAVAVRAGAGRTVVSHLSGLDSSALCSLAVRAGADVVAMTAAQPDAMDLDVEYATETVNRLEARGRIRHEVLPAAEVPLVYAGILDPAPAFDEPFPLWHNARRFLDIVRRGGRHRPVVHLTGFGGDETCSAPIQTIATLLRTSPVTGARYLRHTVVKNRWSYRDVLRGALGRESYRQWLGRTATRIGERDRPRLGHDLGWGTVPTVPAWATPEVTKLAAEELLRAAETAEPLAEDRGVHASLATVLNGSAVASAYQALAETAGEEVSAPFFDDRVVRAALSVRREVRFDPARYKRVLTAAMRGIVPDVALERTGKSTTAATVVTGAARHRDQLRGVGEDSRLAGLGFLDVAAWREQTRGPLEIRRPAYRLEPTIAAETWLRSCERQAE